MMMKFAVLLLVLLVIEAPLSVSALRGAKTSSKKSSEENNEELRYLFFGTSRTWGAKLDNRSLAAFPYLLSATNSTKITPATSTNLAIPGGSSAYPSQCASSMLRDYQEEEAYDVIVLEFSALPASFRNTVILARRLRRRFPNALMLFVDVWLPPFFKHGAGVISPGWGGGPGYQEEGLGLIQHQQQSQNKNSPEDLSNPGDWTHTAASHSYVDAYVTLLQKQVGGVMVQAAGEIPPDAYEILFVDDLGHFSEVGHRFVADLIHKAVSKAERKPRQVNRWAQEDACENWFRTGETNLHYHNMAMNEFKAGKFALEARSDDASLTIVNHHDDMLELTIEYMTTSPECLYPEVEITTDKYLSVTIECKKLSFPWDVHVTATLHVGAIMPGETTIHIKPMKNSVHNQNGGAEWPFRVVGVTLTPDAL